MVGQEDLGGRSCNLLWFELARSLHAQGGTQVKFPLAEHEGYILQRDGLLDPARPDLPGSRAPTFKREIV